MLNALTASNTHARTLLVSAALMVAMWVAPLRAHADYRIFIDFGGAIPVASTLKGFEKTGECSSFSFSTERYAQPGSGETSAAQLSLIEITRLLDAASPRLWMRVLTGKIMPTVKLTLVNGAGIKIAEYSLTDVMISKYSVSGSGDQLPFESFSLSYATIQYTVNTLDPATGKVKTSTVTGWDAAQSQAL